MVTPETVTVHGCTAEADKDNSSRGPICKNERCSRTSKSSAVFQHMRERRVRNIRVVISKALEPLNF
jgi:hypothetical protein